MIYGALRIGRMAARSGGRNPKPANYTWGRPARLIWYGLFLAAAIKWWHYSLIILAVLVLLTVVMAAVHQAGTRDAWARNQLPQMRARREAQQARHDRLDVVRDQYARQDAPKGVRR